MDIERRVFRSQISVRAGGGTTGTGSKLVGHAAVFNKDSGLIYGINGAFIERIATGAFKRSIARGDDVRALVNHDPSLILGRTTSKTLALREDNVGLHVTIDVPETTYGKDLLISTQRGDISQMSFAFSVAPHGETWTTRQDGVQVRTITEFKEIYDISPCAFAAYPDTDVTVQSHGVSSGQASRNEAGYDPGLIMRRRRLLLELAAL